MLLSELAKLLEERSLVLQIRWAHGAWVVWLHADDDPALGVSCEESADIEDAVRRALAAWDGQGEVAADTSN
jgi:hypothetical protein